MSIDTGFDILIRNINKAPIAIVEIRIWPTLSNDDINDILDKILTYTTNFNTLIPYFLLVTPKNGFLWQQPKPNDPPTLEFSMEDVVIRYLPDPIARQNLRGTQFELIILEWLTDLAWIAGETNTEPEKSLAAQGFLSAIREASVLPGVKAL
jgi:hypothetical protein